MICHKCKNKGIENQANGKTFFYCRTCKDEITDGSEPARGISLPSVQDMVDAMKSYYGPAALLPQGAALPRAGLSGLSSPTPAAYVPVPISTPARRKFAVGDTVSSVFHRNPIVIKSTAPSSRDRHGNTLDYYERMVGSFCYICDDDDVHMERDLMLAKAPSVPPLPSGMALRVLGGLSAPNPPPVSLRKYAIGDAVKSSSTGATFTVKDTRPFATDKHGKNIDYYESLVGEPCCLCSDDEVRMERYLDLVSKAPSVPQSVYGTGTKFRIKNSGPYGTVGVVVSGNTNKRGVSKADYEKQHGPAVLGNDGLFYPLTVIEVV